MDHNVYMDIRKLPSFSALNQKVNAVERQCSWWEKYGWDWIHTGIGFIAGGLGFTILQSETYLHTALGFLLLGVSYVILIMRAGHLAAHRAMGLSDWLHQFFFVFFVEFLGGFSVLKADDIHIKHHHPHTNIIGLGDSSTWKAPSVPMIPYMFFVPALIPPLTPLVAIQQLIETSHYKELVKFIVVMVAGVTFRVALFVYISGYSVLGGLLAIWLVQAIFTMQYIHINIFQHIGLPMYSRERRPARIYQMSTGVMNLERNSLLEFLFGHAYISCHVEHHLFPRLGDNMCLKIKPLVKEFLISNNLPYKEDSYWNRLKTFVNKYDELMVKAPPIIHFIGIQ